MNKPFEYIILKSPDGKSVFLLSEYGIIEEDCDTCKVTSAIFLENAQPIQEQSDKFRGNLNIITEIGFQDTDGKYMKYKDNLRVMWIDVGKIFLDHGLGRFVKQEFTIVFKDKE